MPTLQAWFDRENIPVKNHLSKTLEAIRPNPIEENQSLPKPDQHLEELRLNYKPRKIVLLLVGESPPPHKGFFYDTTAPEGQLSRNTRKVFQDQHKTEYAGREEFLAQFKAKQCYLTDLFPQRGRTIQKTNKLDRRKAVNQLTNLLQEEKPKVITPVLKRIWKPVEDALENSRTQARFKPLIYPTRHYIPQYTTGLHDILAKL